MVSEPLFKYGYVVGRFINSQGDSEDLDRLPDWVSANIQVTFNRVRGQYVIPLSNRDYGIKNAFVYHEPVRAGVMMDGSLTGDVAPNGQILPNAEPGLWLVSGLWKVDFGPRFPTVTINVLETHTKEAPLDISLSADYDPPPNVSVQTVALPIDASVGDVLSFTENGWKATRNISSGSNGLYWDGTELWYDSASTTNNVSLTYDGADLYAQIG